MPGAFGESTSSIRTRSALLYSDTLGPALRAHRLLGSNARALFSESRRSGARSGCGALMEIDLIVQTADQGAGVINAEIAGVTGSLVHARTSAPLAEKSRDDSARNSPSEPMMAFNAARPSRRAQIIGLSLCTLAFFLPVHYGTATIPDLYSTANALPQLRLRSPVSLPSHDRLKIYICAFNLQCASSRRRRPAGRAQRQCPRGHGDAGFGRVAQVRRVRSFLADHQRLGGERRGPLGLPHPHSECLPHAGSGRGDDVLHPSLPSASSAHALS